MTLEKDGTLVTLAGHRIAQLRLSAGLFLGRSTVVNGPSGSGKTVIVKNIMNLLRPHVPVGNVVSPSELSNQSYSGCMRRPLTHYEMYLPDASGQRKNDDAKGAVRWLEAFWARAEMMSAVFARVNNPLVLSKLYNRLPADVRQPVDAKIGKMNAKRREIVARLERKYAADPGRAAEKARAVKELFRQWLTRLYKTLVAANVGAIRAGAAGPPGPGGPGRLSADEAHCLENISFNPNQLLVLDDCADVLKSISKSNVFKKLFYRGRHNHISLVICCQDDTDLDTNLRKNAFVTFFTEAQVALSSFTRTSNRFPKPTQRLVTQSVEEIFSKEHKYRKFVYIREDPERLHFYHLTLACPPPFVFGSRAVQDLCDEIEAVEAPLDRSNPFYASFHPGAA